MVEGSLRCSALSSVIETVPFTAYNQSRVVEFILGKAQLLHLG